MPNNSPKAYSYIRFSSPKQKLGDSERRQLEAVEKYAKKQGLVLDKKSSMIDEGLSGYHGKHVQKGALGKFLALIELGKIIPGGQLIIENLDRLSRQKPSDSIELLLSIIKQNITLVILESHRTRVITLESFDNNPGEFQQIAGEIERAYYESKRKSDMLKSAWEDKREEAENGGKKLTAVSPMWLEPVRDKDGDVIDFKPIPKRADAIRKIFELKAGGSGNGKICRTLNQNKNIWKPKKSNRNKTGGWRESYIQKIIHNRAVLGEYQPHKKIDGKRSPVGDVIPDYYPAVVDRTVFDAVHNQLAKYRKKYGRKGRSGNTNKARNLFSYVAKCGQCGGSMHYLDKGEPPKGGKYLRCDTSRRTLTDKETGERICDAPSIRYEDFEDIFFKYIDELDMSALLPDADETAKQSAQISQKIEANQQTIREQKQYKSKLLELSTLMDEETGDVAQKLKSAEAKIQELIRENNKLDKQRREIQTKKVEREKAVSNIDLKRELLDSVEGEEEIKIRTQLRAEIERLVDRLDIYPLNEPFKASMQEVEPGVWLNMESRYVDRVRVRFSGSDNHKAVIRLKRHAVEV